MPLLKGQALQFVTLPEKEHALKRKEPGLIPAGKVVRPGIGPCFALQVPFFFVVFRMEKC